MVRLHHIVFTLDSLLALDFFQIMFGVQLSVLVGNLLLIGYNLNKISFFIKLLTQLRGMSFYSFIDGLRIGQFIRQPQPTFLRFTVNEEMVAIWFFQTICKMVFICPEEEGWKNLLRKQENFMF